MQGNGNNGAFFQFPPDMLRPLVQEIVSATIELLEGERARLEDGRLAYSEPEAAALLGLEPHQLRDERRRGRIQSSSIVGRRIRYMRSDLVAYLMARRSTNGERPADAHKENGRPARPQKG